MSKSPELTTPTSEPQRNMTRHFLKSIMALITSLLAFSSPARAQLPVPTYGWNLGNTLEPPTGEGSWGPAATQNLINAVADAGFNTVRIPCAWNSHANATHQIDALYLARVKQVVDWCYARNLHVILNSHWDGGWLENNITGSVNPTIDAKMQAYWTQIADTFKGYDSKLVFAAANEPAADTAAEMATLLAYYQTFVNVVRATGGNNLTRWLVVQGPSTDIDLTDTLMNALPADPSPSRLMVEIHYYSPYQWTLMSTDADWGKMFYFWGQRYHHATRTDRNANWGEEAYLEAQFQKMAAKFVSKGVPVILGEFQAFKRTGYADLTGADFNLHVASRTFFHQRVVDTALQKEISPIYWDIAGQMFDWTTGAVTDADNVRALTGGAALPPPGSVAGSTGTSHLVNVSIRASAGTGSATLIAGFVLGGQSTKSILLRGIGPTLTDYGVASPLGDPSIVLYNAGATVLGSNNDWSGATALSTAYSTVGAFSLATASKDAAMLTPLGAGGYTMHVTTTSSTAGAALAEVYDANTSSTDLHLINIAGRGTVDASSNLIAGFVVGGTDAMTVLVRAVGPTLGDLGVTGVLSNPKVTIYNRSGVAIASSDDWGGTTALRATFTRVGAFTLPVASKDSAIVLTLSPGPYTAVVSGVNDTTGVALVEVYAVE